MSRKYVILTDSTSDLNAEIRSKYDIAYVAMNYMIDDKEYEASLDWKSHSASEFYDLMRNGTIIKTTQVPGPVFEAKFEQLAKEGTDVIYISCSSALSGSINTAKANPESK